MLQDYKLGLRMLLKYPGLTLAGGLALAVAIGVGAGWYDLSGKILSPVVPLPEGDRVVVVETQNTLTNQGEGRVARDFLEWRRTLRTIDGLGAFRSETRNLTAGDSVPEPVRTVALTATAFATARVTPLLGRPVLATDEAPGAPGVIAIGYDLWQRLFAGRLDVVGSVVRLGDTRATVIGVMPEGFAYPVNYDAWTPLSLRAVYGPLEGSPIGVIGRLAPGVTLEQARAEVRASGERAASAMPATHKHLRPSVAGLAQAEGDLSQTLRNLPVLLVLLIACTSVGTLIYARTATREGEIAVRSALGASRARIMLQLFVEALVLASVAAAAGLVAADRVLTWGINSIDDTPFWITPGLRPSTILYAAVLAVITAAMLSFLPALKVTRARVQTHLAHRAGGATLRFGLVWTGAMVVQVALTAIGIPTAMETANEAMLKQNIRAAFPSREYLAARIDLERPEGDEPTPVLEEQKAQAFAALSRRVAQEPGVVAVTFADHAPGSLPTGRAVEIEPSPGAGASYASSFDTTAVGPGFFEALDRPIVAGRAFHGGDWNPAAHAVLVNQSFARRFASQGGSGSPVGARLRWVAPSAPAPEPWREIVGVVRDIGLNPDDSGDEPAYVFYPASAGALSVMIVRTRGNPATLAAPLPRIAAGVDPRLVISDSRPLETWIRNRDDSLNLQAMAMAGITGLVLFLSALGIFSLVSVSVSRRTREIGLRTALGAQPRHVLTGILLRAVVLMGSGTAAGGGLLLLAVGLGAGPSGRPEDDVPLFAAYLGVTSAVMLTACLLASVGPARRALGINPIEALRDA
jgi:predicted permease